MTRGERAAAAVLGCVGAGFRLHGRDPVFGLDCVGVAAVAARGAACAMPVPSGYRLRGGDGAAVAAMLDGWLARGCGEEAGALLLMRPGAGQLHLGVRVAGGIVHADAGLGRVVMRPGALAWPLVGAWVWGED
jgi:hypothetical protein